MAASLTKQLERCLNGVVVGPPLFDHSGLLPCMVVYPLFPNQLGPAPPTTITLTEGLSRGVRLRDTGQVDRVHVENPLDASILLGESEVLVGKTQTRALQISCLIPPGQRASIPVNCIEERRLTEYHAEFTQADICPWNLRSFKLEQLARHGETHQHRIWDRIETFLSRTESPSPTADLRAVYNTHAFDLNSLRHRYPLHPGQCGAVCAVGQELYLELFSAPELLEDRYHQLLKSALIEAVIAPQEQVGSPEGVRAFLGALPAAGRASRLVHPASLKGKGRSAVFSAQGITGAALMADQEVVHLCAHQRCWGRTQPFPDVLPHLDQARADWEGGAFFSLLEEEYGPRRRRYQAFKEQLDPSAPPEERKLSGRLAPQGDVRGLRAPPPRPLAPRLHDFFLRIFQQH
ncbi:MAG: hypothetical protein FJY95_17185 [Candidatus Handelsmanbacteria bacterium]|nr:hypothetical protein [Candidatus Handelsmanbacteria bacterium]